jgi:uncharacterized protein YqeY
MLCLADDMVLSEKWRIIMEFKKLQSDMVAAMKARDKARKDTISSLISAAKKLAIDEGKRDDIPEELVDRAIIKEEKTAQEQVDSCPADREDLKAEYQARLDVIKEYAPKMMSPEEIEEVLKTQFADVIATKNKGQIMKAVMAELKGKANGKDINQIVGKLCQ